MLESFFGTLIIPIILILLGMFALSSIIRWHFGIRDFANKQEEIIELLKEISKNGQNNEKK